MKPKTFQPPTKEEFIRYVTDNKLNIKNPESLWQGYDDGGWIDTRGNPVRNWKLKTRTLSNMAEIGFIPTKPKDISEGKCCHRCGSSINVVDGKSGIKLWRERLPWCSLRCYELWIKEGRPNYE